MQASNEVGKVGGRNTRDTADANITAEQQTQEAGKLGKSKGAAPFTELLKNHAPETLRFFLLSTHYRRPIDFSETRINEVNTGLEQFYRFFKRYERITGHSFYSVDYPRERPQGDFTPGDDATLVQIADHRRRFLDAMDDDFNTGGAVGDLFELVRTLNKFADEAKFEIQQAHAGPAGRADSRRDDAARAWRYDGSVPGRGSQARRRQRRGHGQADGARSSSFARRPAGKRTLRRPTAFARR